MSLNNCIIKTIKSMKYLTLLLLKLTSAGIALLLIVFFSTSNLSLSSTNSTNMNRLKNEKSPYLLQHADNPVDWYPWGEEAFEKAKKEDKPILLSIGYSTCHWCHVMEHESFEDEEVAKLMNETFVSIKVDREERPDIDNIYMTVCQILSQRGCGWPLNIIMTPDKKPFFAGTYIPKQTRFGRMGMVELIPKIQNIWQNEREEAMKSAESVTVTLKKVTDPSQNSFSENLDNLTLKRGFQQLSSRFDNVNGGFGNRPKFPTPHNLLFLLRYYKRSGDQEALDMVTKTLDSMSFGGIYDHVGFGFHRYSTDPKWFLPHFEKMLYDQALLAMAYVETYQVTKNPNYERVAREIFSYVLRDMTSPEGGFYSAEDADSEGEEGKFYLWTQKEIIEIIGEEEANIIFKVYNLQPGGNFNEEATGEILGTNIFHLTKPISAIANEMKISEDELKKRIESSRQKLFNVRENRVHPLKDDKILTDWNGLMIAALSKAAQAFGDTQYADAASKSADFINTYLIRDSRLLHRFRGGESAISANIDDYAFFIWGLLELYEANFDTKYLKQALKLNQDMIKYFWDDTNGGFYFTPSDGEELLVRQKDIYDGAIPSGNSVAFLNLLRLSRITANTNYEQRANELANAFSPSLNKAPISYTLFLTALDFAAGPSYEVVIAGNKNSKDTDGMLNTLRNEYIPNKVVLFRDEDSVVISEIAPYTKAQKSLNGMATAYVCLNFVCKLPTTDPNQMLKLFKTN